MTRNLEMVERVAVAFGELVDEVVFVEAVSGHLPGDAASQARVPIVLDRLRAIAGL